jgi:hypothetical protein
VKSAIREDAKKRPSTKACGGAVPPSRQADMNKANPGAESTSIPPAQLLRCVLLLIVAERFCGLSVMGRAHVAALSMSKPLKCPCLQCEKPPIKCSDGSGPLNWIGHVICRFIQVCKL